MKNLDDLAYILAAHADNLQLYARTWSDDIVEEWQDTESTLFRDLLAALALFGTFRHDAETNRKLQKIYQLIAAARNAAVEQSEDYFSAHIDELVENESSWQFNWLIAIGSSVAANALSRAAIQRIKSYGRYGGLTVKEIFQKVKTSDVERIYTAVASGLQNHRPITDIVNQVKKECDKTNTFVSTNVFAIVNGVSNDVSMAVAAKAKQKMQYVAVLDRHVCADCRELDGTIYAYDDDLPAVPQHANCRCRLVVVNDDLEKEIRQ